MLPRVLTPESHRRCAMPLLEDITALAAPIRVLYVDDHPGLADAAVALLRLVGFDARAAYDGPAALAVAARFAPHACVLDLNMPGMDGDQLAVRLRQAVHPPPLLVAVTARDDPDSCKRLATAGFHHVFVKPPDPLRLVAVLRQWWEK